MSIYSKRARIMLRATALVLALFNIYCTCSIIVGAVAMADRASAEDTGHDASGIAEQEESITVENTEVTEVIEDLEPEPVEPKKELINMPVVFFTEIYTEFYDIDLSTKYIAELSGYIQEVEEAIASNDYTRDAMLAMEDELSRLHNIIDAVEADIAKYTIWEQNHYYAAKTYEFLRRNGYSAEVACGIIGNMMVETSGGTLALKPMIYSPDKSYYGLCQWSIGRKPTGVDGSDASFEEQLVYLHEDLPYQFNVFGHVFNTSYDKFLALKDPAKAANIFAKVYERCGSGSYGARRSAAKVAYEYFTGEL